MLDYNEPSKEDRERINQNNIINRRDMQEIKKDPYRGKIIKRGNYTYNGEAKALSYEETVNQFLEELSQASQNNVNTLVNQQKIIDAAKQICPSPQGSADAFVQQQGNVNRANEIVRQGSSQEIARKILADREDGER